MSGLSFALAGAVLFALALHAVFARHHLLRKIIACNVAASGVFMILVGMSSGGSDGRADAVPQALVLTGIVISVSLTAFLLSLLRRLASGGGAARLPEDER